MSAPFVANHSPGRRGFVTRDRDLAPRMDGALAETSLDRATNLSSPPPSCATRDDWEVRERDIPRRTRLAAAAFFPALGVSLLVAFAPSIPPPAKIIEDDPPIEALLVDAPPDVLPPAQLAPEQPSPAAPAPGPRLARVEAPTDIPKAAPERDVPATESTGEPAPAAEGPPGGGGPPGSTGTSLTAPPAPPPVAAARPPAPKPSPVPEEITPPKAISMRSPAYPSAAKSAGIEGTVVIAYTVGESGAVTDARVVKGPPELAAACLEAVRGWRFTPAESGGRPVPVKRSARFPFRLKT